MYDSVRRANEEGRRMWQTTTLRKVELILRGDGTVDARCWVSGPSERIRVIAARAWPAGYGGFADVWQEAGVWAGESFWASPTPPDLLSAHRASVDSLQQPVLPLDLPE